jgi:hypothetical protein
MSKIYFIQYEKKQQSIITGDGGIESMNNSSILNGSASKQEDEKSKMADAGTTG